jgi:cytochrome c551/c552
MQEILEVTHRRDKQWCTGKCGKASHKRQVVQETTHQDIAAKYQDSSNSQNSLVVAVKQGGTHTQKDKEKDKHVQYIKDKA